MAEAAEDLEQRAGLRAAFPADDPELAAALIARLADGGASAKLAARSLGNSHDARAADALIHLLGDPDPHYVPQPRHC